MHRRLRERSPVRVLQSQRGEIGRLAVLSHLDSFSRDALRTGGSRCCRTCAEVEQKTGGSHAGKDDTILCLGDCRLVLPRASFSRDALRSGGSRCC
eukprot:gene57120-biopygen107285